DIVDNPLDAVENFCSSYPVTLLLKGPTTLVGNNKKVYFVNKGCPGMATAGSGDVLSGVLAGILGYSKMEIAYTSACAAYINGLAGEMASSDFGDICMTSGDTARSISRAINLITK
ncbi:MAG: hypothetical protein MJ241_05610, partial [Bacilli bacterium]|nr:hypothetical protein [Bacilli bacterium]